MSKHQDEAIENKKLQSRGKEFPEAAHRALNISSHGASIERKKRTRVSYAVPKHINKRSAGTRACLLLLGT
jgi:hypothetical protein